MRAALCLSFLLSLFAALPSGAAAEERLALVIGNGRYHAAPLKNPANDARLMAETLEAQDFTVTALIDGSRKEMKSAVRAFAHKLRKVGDDAVAVFFFAGHGVQIDGRNFLIPVRTEIKSAADVEFESIDAQWVLDQIAQSRVGLSLIILDACRNNPFRSLGRSASRGLARMDAPRGSMLAYSTAPGAVALDGAGANSPYTEALTRAMRAPGLKVEEVFKEARRSVLAVTKDQQIPWESSSLIGDFYFTGVPDPAEPATAQTPAAQTPAAPTQETDERPPGQAFTDCEDCLEMVSIPAGTFQMGAEKEERWFESNQSPATQVSIPAFALSKTEVTRGQFAAFVAETGYKATKGCWYWYGLWLADGSRDWRSPGYAQEDTHPVVCTSYADANAYTEWLSKRTDKRYRLPSEAEFEYAAAAGKTDVDWVTQEDRACRYANVHDAAADRTFSSVLSSFSCDDGMGMTGPVAMLEPNQFGLYDMIGNAMEMMEDCWNGDHRGRPSNAQPRRDGDCSKRVWKGSNFANYKETFRPAWRMDGVGNLPNIYGGFRLARDWD